MRPGHEEAIKAFDKAVEIKPDYITALYNKGNVLDHIGNVDAAAETYDRIIKLKPMRMRHGIIKDWHWQRFLIGEMKH